MTQEDDAQPIVYIVDDDASVLAAVEDLLASVHLRARAFSSTAAFLEAGIEDAPACLVLDVRMPVQSEMDFQRQMADLGLRLPVIFITGHGDIAMSVRAMKAGAVEFLTKPFQEQELLDAIHRGLDTDRRRREEDAVSHDLRRRWDALTTGEQEVFRLVVQGYLNKQIAAMLELQEITVKVRRGRVMKKMKAAAVPDLVRAYDRLFQ